MRVGIIELMHESNTFLATPTTLASFEACHRLRGPAIRDLYHAAAHEVGGFFTGLDEAHVEAVPLTAAWAMPAGVITAETGERLVADMLEAVQQAGPLDGLLVAPHGAAVAEHQRDFDGYWLSRLREAIGPDTPLVATLDLHANVSRRMVDACTALVAYRTNPHLDQRDRGLEAARLIVGTIEGRLNPTMAAALPPLAINIERQLTSQDPCRALYQRADSQLVMPAVLSNSIVLGFPYSDVAELGSSFIVVTDDDATLARQLVDELAAFAWERRASLEGQFVSIAQAVSRAVMSSGPIGLLDMGDNVGGGSPGDGTLLLAALSEAGVGHTLACLYDPAAVQLCREAGVGRQVSLSLGGHTDDRHGRPLAVDAQVESLGDGRFRESAVRHGGQTQYDMGSTAVVRLSAGPTILITSRRMAPFSLAQVTSVGLDPSRFQAIVIKGVHAPVAAYQDVCRELVRVDTPGVTRADMTQLTFQHRRRPLFPFEHDFTWGTDSATS